jgi:hypothetical protein
MRPVLIAILAIVMLALVGTIGYLLLAPGAADLLAPTETITDPDRLESVAVSFVQTPFPNDYDTVRVPGWVDNVSTTKIRSVTLEVQLIDQDGSRRELITHVVKDLEAGTRRSFDVNAGTLVGPRTAEVRVVEAVVIP